MKKLLGALCFLIPYHVAAQSGGLHINPDGSVLLTKEQAEALELNFVGMRQEIESLREQLKAAMTKANLVKHCS